MYWDRVCTVDVIHECRVLFSAHRFRESGVVVLLLFLGHVHARIIFGVHLGDSWRHI